MTELTDAAVAAKPHAPRGPVKARDPIGSIDPMEARCTATNRKGQRCGKPHIPGGTVCRMHGGAAPQVLKAAKERLLELQPRAIRRMGELIEQTEFPTVAFAASRDILDRTDGKPVEKVTVTGEDGGPVRHIFSWEK